MLIQRTQRGDTLIEVLFAFSILSSIIVGSMAIMNLGATASQKSLETTLVRQQIDGQATTLRFLHDAYVAKFQPDPNAVYAADTPAGQWALMSKSLTATSATSVAACTWPRPNTSFILDSVNAKFIPYSSQKLKQATTFAQLTYDANSTNVVSSDGIWIEGVKSVARSDAQKNTRYIDFHIYACWDSPGQGPPLTIGTIVRLYEPQS